MEPDYYKKRLLPKFFKEQPGKNSVACVCGVCGKKYYNSGSLSSMSTTSTGASVRKKRVSEVSLNPYSGALKCRIDYRISHLLMKCRRVDDYC